ncbi:hypothetical protein DNF11_1334 [Malassezia restricta CBS 7877]|uniref:Uncharacterized protein n=1 Tax=Malassezia restricta (strain ATCC 96810 / NBRC 103918 / CBS 7877) TaxID=425264 RepID=A0A3G2S2S8_MALR7|nr:hypothetical protein DNF11_1334 [Malassezia restricta CBS 7877]
METQQAVSYGAIACAVLAIVTWVFWPRPASKKSSDYDPKTGLGRGAPGFQTNVKRVALPAELVARIRAGEQVSAEEITAAQSHVSKGLPSAPKENDWLGPTATSRSKKTTRRKNKK